MFVFQKNIASLWDNYTIVWITMDTYNIQVDACYEIFIWNICNNITNTILSGFYFCMPQHNCSYWCEKNISALILLRTHGKVKFLEKVVVHNFIVFEIKMLELVPKSFSEPDVILWDFYLAIGSRTGNVCQKAIKTKVGFESD